MPPEPTFPCNGHSELRQLSFFTSRDLVDERTASSEIGLKLYHARRLGAGRQHLIAEAPRIASRYRCVTTQELAEVNNVRAPRYLIKVGQQLRIPGCS